MSSTSPIQLPDRGLFYWGQTDAPVAAITLLNKLAALEIVANGNRFPIRFSGENAIIELSPVLSGSGLAAIAPYSVLGNINSTSAVPIAQTSPVLTSVVFGGPSGGYIGGSGGNLTLTTVGSLKDITLGASDAIILGSLVRHQITTTTGAFNNDLVIECLLGAGNIHITSRQAVYLNPSNANNVFATCSGNGRFNVDNSDSHCIITTTTQTAGKSAYLWLQRNGGPSSIVGVSGAANFLSNGCVADDLCLVTNDNMIFSTNNGGSAALKLVKTTGQLQFLIAPPVLFVTTVAGLPAATTPGQVAHVTDALTSLTLGIGLVVAGGGANYSPVHSNGTNWIQG